MNFCPMCGRRLDGSEKFCPCCGWRVPPAPPDSEQEPESPKEDKPDREPHSGDELEPLEANGQEANEPESQRDLPLTAPYHTTSAVVSIVLGVMMVLCGFNGGQMSETQYHIFAGLVLIVAGLILIEDTPRIGRGLATMAGFGIGAWLADKGILYNSILYANLAARAAWSWCIVNVFLALSHICVLIWEKIKWWVIIGRFTR